MVTATLDNNYYDLANILKVPNSILRDEIMKKTSTFSDIRERVMEYGVQYSPRATWAELAGELYRRKRGEALAAARKFIKRTPGKCVI